MTFQLYIMSTPCPVKFSTLTYKLYVISPDFHVVTDIG